MKIYYPDEEKLGLVDLLKRTIDEDRYPLSPRILTFKAILAKLEAESVPVSPYPAPNEHFPGSGTPGVLGALPGYALSWCRCASARYREGSFWGFHGASG